MDGERRAHPRKVVSTSVTFHDADGAPLRGWLHDISRGGCFVASPSHLTFGETVELEMRLLDAQLEGTGRVVWVRDKNERDLPAGMGIAFIAINEATLAVVDGLSVTNARLSRPNTVIGIAPAPPASMPSFSPDVQPASAPEPPPEPVIPSPLAPPPEPVIPWKTRLRVPILGAAAALVLAVIGVIAFTLLRSSGSSATAEDAAPVDAAVVAEEDAAPPVEDAAPLAAEPVEAGTPEAGPVDAGHDGGRKHGKPHHRTKPRKKKK